MNAFITLPTYHFILSYLMCLQAHINMSEFSEPNKSLLFVVIQARVTRLDWYCWPLLGYRL